MKSKTLLFILGLLSLILITGCTTPTGDVVENASSIENAYLSPSEASKPSYMTLRDYNVSNVELDDELGSYKFDVTLPNSCSSYEVEEVYVESNDAFGVKVYTGEDERVDACTQEVKEYSVIGEVDDSRFNVPENVFLSHNGKVLADTYNASEDVGVEKESLRDYYMSSDNVSEPSGYTLRDYEENFSVSHESLSWSGTVVLPNSCAELIRVEEAYDEGSDTLEVYVWSGVESSDVTSVCATTVDEVDVSGEVPGFVEEPSRVSVLYNGRVVATDKVGSGMSVVGLLSVVFG